MDDRRAVLDELTDLRARLAALEARLAMDDSPGGPGESEAVVTEWPEGQPSGRDGSARTDRRGALKWAGAAAAGLAGGAVLGGSGTASAANGDALVLGSTANVAGDPTKLASGGSPGLEITAGSSATAIRGAVSGTGVGVEGDGGGGTGVSGKGTFYGVDGRGDIAGVIGKGPGAGVRGETDTGVALSGHSVSGIGLTLSTPQSHSVRFSGPGMKPISGTWVTGDLVAGSGGMWFCYSGGPAASAKWVELSAPALLMNRTNATTAITVLDAAATATPFALRVTSAGASNTGIGVSGVAGGVAASSAAGLAVAGVTSTGSALAGGTSGSGGIGLRLEGTGGPSIRFTSGATVPPDTGTWQAGDVAGSPSGLWFCYLAGVGPASKWVKISSALVTLPVPVRVYDSRPGQAPLAIGPKTPLVAATPRTIDCTGNSSGVPTGVSSVLLNVASTNNPVSGYLAVYKNGVAFPNTSNLNWTAGQSIGVTTVSSVDTQSRVAIWAQSATDVVVDVIGFYP